MQTKRKNRTTLLCIRAILFSALCYLSLTYSFLAHSSQIVVAQNLEFGSAFPFMQNWERRSPVCVWNESKNIYYRVEARGYNNSSKFQLMNEMGDSLPYFLFWHRQSSYKPSEQLLPGRLSNQVYSFSNRPECGGEMNATLSARLAIQQVTNAHPGNYFDTIAITISPL